MDPLGFELLIDGALSEVRADWVTDAEWRAARWIPLSQIPDAGPSLHKRVQPPG